MTAPDEAAATASVRPAASGRGVPPSGLAPGTPVAARFTKWGGGRHWEWTGSYLGADAHGHWWSSPAGTRCSRPGVSFVEEHGWVSFVPHDGAYAAGFYPEPKEVSVYVDMTTEPVWQRRAADGGPEWEVTMVDLDLDVVLTRDGHLYVDDEDEFERHRAELGYPAEVVALAEHWRDVVLEAVASGKEPFLGAGQEWLRRASAAAASGTVAAGDSADGSGR